MKLKKHGLVFAIKDASRTIPVSALILQSRRGLECSVQTKCTDACDVCAYTKNPWIVSPTKGAGTVTGRQFQVRPADSGYNTARLRAIRELQCDGDYGTAYTARTVRFTRARSARRTHMHGSGTRQRRSSSRSPPTGSGCVYTPYPLVAGPPGRRVRGR